MIDALPRQERGRPRKFDVATAIGQAMDVFWTHGYHGTSLPDLLQATKLSRGSLYAAFGDKRGLFLQALDRYIADALRRVDGELDDAAGAMAGVRTCLVGYVDRTSGAAGVRGCLVVATAMELAAHDPDVERRIAAFFDAMKRRIAAALLRARDDGDLAEGVDAASVAHLLLCTVEGMRVVGKTRPDREVSIAMVDELIATLRR